MRRLILSLPILLWAAWARADEDPTYTKDIAPILWKHCAGCHRPGEIGPFSLLTYQDAAKRASFLKEITASRRMPPWKAEPAFGAFHDVRRLSDAEIQTIAAWADAGAPEGDPQDLPPRPQFPEGWQLGEPDLVLKMPEPFEVPASGRDLQRCFVIPIPITSDKTVTAVEFRPGNRRVVHHALLYLDTTGTARRKDEADPGPGYNTFGGPGILPTGGLGGWAPGAMPRRLPEGIGKYLRGGSDLVLQIHYHPDGKLETDQSVVGIYFTKTPAKKLVAGIAVRSRNLYIPPGEKRHHVTAQSAPLPVDVQAIGIAPHMHNLGREMKVVAETPDGRTVPMIWITDWDFNWQGQYLYQEPVRLPKGTVFKVDAYYDNSADNPRNPNKPPKLVTWGEQTTDEMCLCGVQVVTDTLADLRAIAQMRGNGLGAALVGGLVERLRPARTAALPAGGIPIPEPFRERLGRFDQNGDGKLSRAEIDAMPEPLRGRIRQAIEQRLGTPDRD
ncbi:MAG: ascorbate-dependent monooxygenase [Isosphaeraceae bacterium]|nr:ascorbate-dependent monooxygenase [Isosphaeraceae bacterium]